MQLSMETKRCSHCKETKTLDQFYKAAKGSKGRHSYCNPCQTIRQREWRAKNPEKSRKRSREANKRLRALHPERYRDSQLRSLYGIGVAEWQEMHDAQNGVCLICAEPPGKSGRAKNLHVDHCHETGRVRGLLCTRCNTALGLFRDNPDLLRLATAYLEADG